jgi:hypothetical protein
MKKYWIGIWYSLPMQLFMLHFRRHQLFLFIWYILFATVGGGFLKTFGADSLFLAPEYFGEISALSTAIVGFASGVFFMSWNITTFTLHSKDLRFLATNSQPFLKYCINNSVIPLSFLIYYLIEAVQYATHRELFSFGEILLLAVGYVGGLFLCLTIAFVYFFSADRTIYKDLSKAITQANRKHDALPLKKRMLNEKSDIRVDWFLTAKFSIRKPRDVKHYSPEFLENIFTRHHISAVLAIVLAFLFLILVGYSSDQQLFQLPAAASITLFFAILIAFVGAMSILLYSWSIPVLIVLYLIANVLYQQEIIDPRNKAYGLDYVHKNDRPFYCKEAIDMLANNKAIEADKKFYLQILNNWKAKQSSAKPIFYIITTSGGGTRSACFTMNVLQELNLLTKGELMKKTFLINGASGGMLGAAYFRELYFEKLKGRDINLQDKKYTANISKDLLSPVFSSYLTRDLLSPVQKFTYNGFKYNKDRGYAFEQKLNLITEGILNKPISAYKDAEAKATIPVMFFNTVITRDGRKMIMASSPVRFLMKPPVDQNKVHAFEADAIDFNSFLKNQHSDQISILSALRMNATFPYVLPNVWLPTNPIIDVMDAGIRDNYGQESALRFIEVFKEWLKENTSSVVLIQIRDRKMSDWEKPLGGNSLSSFFTKPFLVLQNNWFKMQDYSQHDQLTYLSKSYGSNFHHLAFQYMPTKKEAAASLSFHLTAAEKNDITHALNNPINQQEFEKLKWIMGNAQWTMDN